jgi:hypothetical protein
MNRPGTSTRPQTRGLGAFAPILPAPWLIRVPVPFDFSGADLMSDPAGVEAIADARQEDGASRAEDGAFSMTARPADTTS